MSIERHLKPFLDTYTCYASNKQHRANAASGGVVTTIMTHLLEIGAIDGAALCRSSFRDGKLSYDFSIVTNPDNCLEYASSAYYDIPVHRHLGEIKKFPGRVAICALPCHIEIFDRMRKKGNLSNVNLLVSLFCGHNSSPELIRFIMKSHSVEESMVERLFFCRSYIKGNLNFYMKNGSLITIPFKNFNVYRNLWFFSKKLCLHCNDHLGNHSDISVGDIYSPKFRTESIKHSSVAIRSQEGKKALYSAKKNGLLIAKKINPSEIVKAQKRVVVPSNDMKSRSMAAKLLNIQYKRYKNSPFRLRSFISYFLLFMNSRLTESSTGRRLLNYIPYWFLWGELILIKAINTTLKSNK